MSTAKNPGRQLVLVEIAPPTAPSDPYQIITPIGDIMGVTPFQPPQTWFVGKQIYIPCQAMNGVGPFQWTGTSMPAGTSIDINTGEITGTLTTQTYSEATITCTDLGNGSLAVTTVLAFDVGPAFRIFGSLNDFTFGAAYQNGLFALGFTGTLTWSISGAPTGVSISSTTGIISAASVAGAFGTYKVIVSAADSGTGTTASKTFLMTSNRNPGSVGFDGVTTPPRITAGAAYKTTCALIDSTLGNRPAGTAPVVWTQTGLPTGIDIDPGSGIISGTCATASTVGTYSVTITGTDVNGAVASRTLSFIVVAGINLIASPNQFLIGSTTDPQGVTGVDYLAQFFGNGGDGNVTVSTSISLTRDMFYDTLTIAAGCQIKTQGFDIFCRTALDLSNAPVDSITVGPFGITSNLVQGGSVLAEAGAIGPVGGVTAGTVGVSPTSSFGSSFPAGGGLGSGGGKGGNGSSGTGGNGAAADTSGSSIPWVKLPFWENDVLFAAPSPITIAGGTAGGSGGSGAGNGVGAGGKGGNSGASAGRLRIYARNIITTGSTAAGCISANGCNGTAGTAAVNANTGGGGGGGAGAGGFVRLCYAVRTGLPVVGLIRAAGGNGGNGGALNGTGTNGAGAAGAAAGAVLLQNLMDSTQSYTVGAAGGVASGITGGTGGALAVTF